MKRRIVPQPQEGKICGQTCGCTSSDQCKFPIHKPAPQKEEAKTVEGKTPFEILSTFTGDDSFRLQQNHRNRIIMAMQAYSSQQNKALMEENARLIEALNAFVNSCYTGISKDGLDQLRINAEKVLRP